MMFIATILILGLTAGSSYWYLRLAPETSTTLWKIRCAFRGAFTFLVIFFIINGLIDGHMPRFFLRFINRHGDPAGVSLILLLSGGLNYLSAKHLFTKTVP